MQLHWELQTVCSDTCTRTDKSEAWQHLPSFHITLVNLLHQDLTSLNCQQGQCVTVTGQAAVEAQLTPSLLAEP